MEPLKPEKRQQILTSSQALPEDVEEYERLLSERFIADPNRNGNRSALHANLLAAPDVLSPEERREARLKELYQKISTAKEE